MKQLTLQDLYDICKHLQAKKIDLSEIPVYLGDDEELNGVHQAWYYEMIDKSKKDFDNQYVVKLIEDTCMSEDFKKRGFLIS